MKNKEKMFCVTQKISRELLYQYAELSFAFTYAMNNQKKTRESLVSKSRKYDSEIKRQKQEVLCTRKTMSLLIQLKD